MDKYFSSVLCSKGFCCAYSTIYKKDPYAKIYIINGDDYEKTVFFSQLTKSLAGYNITLFNPFYDESTDGIYIKNLNAYILSDGGYNKISPILPNVWEKHINVSDEKSYPTDLLREVLILKSQENNHYRSACNYLHRASLIKERIHHELSSHINEDKIINFIHRLWSKELRDINEKAKGEIRLLSSPTPLGFHTHYDTIFNLCDKTVNIVDETGFVGAIILGVIKNHAINNKIPIIVSPSYYNNDFFQFLIFPTIKLSLCISDNSHILPFEPAETLTASRFMMSSDVISNRNIEALSSIEEKFLKKAIMSIYEGREKRFKYNDLTKGYSDPQKAQEFAKKFIEKTLF